jgi:hypothetical protein
MIVFRQADARYPFLWEDAAQPAGRWHAHGEGPAHYFADTPDGAWAELLRHEEITEAEDLLTIRRQLWAVEIGDAPIETVTTPASVMTGGLGTRTRGQADARTLRARGVQRLEAPSAALVPGGARGYRVQGGVTPSAPRDGRVVVLFGPPDGLVGWIAAEDAHPPVDLLARVNHYRK